MPTIAAYLNPEFLAADNPWATAKSQGFDMVEVPASFFTTPNDEQGWSELARTLRENGLTARWHCKPRDNRDFGSEDAGLRQASIDRMFWELLWVSRIGWSRFILHSGHAGTKEDRKRAREALSIVNDRARELGIQLELENGSNPFNGDPEELIATCKQVPGLKLTFDCSHAYRSAFCKAGRGSIIDHLNLIRPFVSSIQFNDYDGSANCAVGRGLLPWDRLMPTIVEMECGIWGIELMTIEETVATREFLSRWSG